MNTATTTQSSLFHVVVFVAAVVVFTLGMRKWSTTETIAMSTTAKTATCRPVQIAVLIDFTASGTRYGVALPTVADIETLVGAIVPCGGTIGIGSIQEDARMPLRRLQIDPPSSDASEPARSDFPDVFTYNKALRRWKENRDSFEKQSRDREGRIKRERQHFLDELSTLLERGAIAQSTDVYGSIRRANTYLQEEHPEWSKPPLRVALLVTDGEHNVASSPPVDVLPGTIVCVAHGSSEMGVLGSIDPPPKRFESVTGAVNFIVNFTKEGGN